MTDPQTPNPALGAEADAPTFAVKRATGPLLRSAIARLVEAGGRSGDNAVREFIASARLHGISLDNMWCSISNEPQADEHVAQTACLTIPGEGSTAMLFTSAPSEALIGELAAVLRSACNASKRGTLLQTLIDPSEKLAHRAFLEARFTDVGSLEYLTRPRPSSREAADWKLESGDLGGGVRMINAPTDDDGPLEAALEQSYQQTLDCPELCGLRATRDVITSHRATGAHDPRFWWLIVDGETPVGAVLFNPNPAQSAVELVYMGLAPSMRGKGIAARALRHALAMCAARPECAVTCAVDRRNVPAKSLYTKHGFKATQTRFALVYKRI